MHTIQFTLTQDFIELFKLLKTVGVCESGGMAKHFISEGKVLVDGTIELRKAFKVRRGHSVECFEKKILIS